MEGRRVHVVGDTIVDSYTHCAMIGGQTKTPTMSVAFERKVDFVGGAGIVAKHLMAAGAEVALFSTALGNDPLKDFVIEDLKGAGVELNAVIDETRPTVNKNAIVVGGYRLLKVDTLDNRSISDDVLGKVIAKVKDCRRSMRRSIPISDGGILLTSVPSPSGSRRSCPMCPGVADSLRVASQLAATLLSSRAST